MRFDHETRTWVRNDLITLECLPLTLELAQQDAWRLKDAIVASEARKLKLTTRDLRILSLNETRSMAEAMAQADGLEEVGFYGESWWNEDRRLEETYSTRYFALGNFMKTLTENPTLRKVSFSCFPNWSQACNLRICFLDKQLPIEIEFAAGIGAIQEEQDRAGILSVAQYLRKHFGSQIKFNVPDYYEYKTVWCYTEGRCYTKECRAENPSWRLEDLLAPLDMSVLPSEPTQLVPVNDVATIPMSAPSASSASQPAKPKKVTRAKAAAPVSEAPFPGAEPQSAVKPIAVRASSKVRPPEAGSQPATHDVPANVAVASAASSTSQPDEAEKRESEISAKLKAAKELFSEGAITPFSLSSLDSLYDAEDEESSKKQKFIERDARYDFQLLKRTISAAIEAAAEKAWAAETKPKVAKAAALAAQRAADKAFNQRLVNQARRRAEQEAALLAKKKADEEAAAAKRKIDEEAAAEERRKVEVITTTALALEAQPVSAAVPPSTPPAIPMAASVLAPAQQPKLAVSAAPLSVAPTNQTTNPAVIVAEPVDHPRTRSVASAGNTDAPRMALPPGDALVIPTHFAPPPQSGPANVADQSAGSARAAGSVRLAPTPPEPKKSICNVG